MKKKNFVSYPEKTPKKKGWQVFLAGPVQGAPDWQNEVPEIKGVTWISPRGKEGVKYDTEANSEWERVNLLTSDVILFWIPKQKENLVDREYARTTRFELGEWYGRGKKLIIGTYPEFGGRNYIKTKHKGEVHETLEDCIKELTEYIEEKSKNPGIFFTSDTHFGSSRTLELSRRPFGSVEEMDWEMIQKWNDTVIPGSQVIHVGDFGKFSNLKYLNGEISLVLGNYEIDALNKDEKALDYLNKLFDGRIYDVLELDEFIVTHKPTDAFNLLQETGKEFAIFGHIHGRQKIKPFGIDVGVDGNNFKPVSIEEVRFYTNAIKKGYYDEDVWTQGKKERIFVFRKKK